MSKNDVLNKEEFQKYAPNEIMLRHLEHYCKKQGLERDEINISDWGCGRGRDVLWLREHGYKAFGVDIDQGTIQNGLSLFREMGYDDSLLGLIDVFCLSRSETKTEIIN